MDWNMKLYHSLAVLPLKPNHASAYWNEQQNGVLVHQCQDLTHRRSEAARCQN